MADNVSITAGSGTTVAADEPGGGAAAGAKVQRVKPMVGKDGEATDVSNESPMPVSDAGGTLSVDDGGGALTVDGTVAVSGTVPVSDGGGTLSIDDGAGSVTVDGTVGVSSLPELPAGTKAIGSVVASKLEGEPKVKVAELPPLPTGTNSVGKVKALEEALPASANNIGQVDPRGNVAHGASDSGNPVKTGARARTALPAAVTQDQRVDNVADKFGRQLVAVAPLDERVSATLNRTNTESGQLLAALENGAYVVTAISVTNAHATVSGGFVVADPNGLFVGTKNTKLNGKCATTGADVDIAISAYKIPA